MTKKERDARETGPAVAHAPTPPHHTPSPLPSSPKKKNNRASERGTGARAAPHHMLLSLSLSLVVAPHSFPGFFLSSCVVLRSFEINATSVHPKQKTQTHFFSFFFFFHPFVSGQAQRALDGGDQVVARGRHALGALLGGLGSLRRRWRGWDTRVRVSVTRTNEKRREHLPHLPSASLPPPSFSPCPPPSGLRPWPSPPP